MTPDRPLFEELRQDVADFPDGEISVESAEIAALLDAYDAAYEQGYRDAVNLYASPRRA